MRKVKLYLLTITLLALFSSHSQASSWDMDGNDNIDALTDGLLLLRHTFDLRGAALTDGVMADDSPMSSAQVEQRIADAYAIADIDGSGQVDALTDALILLRYLFELRGDQLVVGAIADDASRSSSSDIEQYIVDHMSSDNSDSGSSGITVSDPAVINEAFGGASYEGETFTFPSGAEAWAGFANMNTDLYPITFPDGGSLSFTGAVPSGGSVNVRFRFEYNPYPDVDPAYDTQTVTVSGADENTYSISIPSQGNNTFSSLIMYVVDRDAPVTVSNLVLSSDGGSNDSGADDSTGDNAGSDNNGSNGDAIDPDFGDSVVTVSDAAVIDEAFGGATYQGETFTFPFGAETWAGFANMNTSLYPLMFESGGLLSFTGSVPSGGSVNVRFRF
jgi:hypothetical protein